MPLVACWAPRGQAAARDLCRGAVAVPPSRAGPSAAAPGRCGTGRPRAAASRGRPRPYPVRWSSAASWPERASRTPVRRDWTTRRPSRDRSMLLQSPRLSRIRDPGGAFERSRRDQPSSDAAVMPHTPSSSEGRHSACHAAGFRLTVSCWVRLPQFRVALMSGDVWLGPGTSGVVGPWFGPGCRVSSNRHCRPVGRIDHRHGE
jgi:hypothetical protein